ncbi:hypothetical protein AVEN_109207-1, partial [Araneus ventricosus]
AKTRYTRYVSGTLYILRLDSDQNSSLMWNDNKACSRFSYHVHGGRRSCCFISKFDACFSSRHNILNTRGVSDPRLRASTP